MPPSRVWYGKTAEMVTPSEGEQSPADVIFAQDSGHLGVLAQRGALHALPTVLTVMASFRDEGGTWVGVGCSGCSSDNNALTPEQLPQRLEDLAAAWKGRVGWAPGGSARSSASPSSLG